MEIRKAGPWHDVGAPRIWHLLSYSHNPSSQKDQGNLHKNWGHPGVLKAQMPAIGEEDLPPATCLMKLGQKVFRMSCDVPTVAAMAVRP